MKLGLIFLLAVYNRVVLVQGTVTPSFAAQAADQHEQTTARQTYFTSAKASDGFLVTETTTNEGNVHSIRSEPTTIPPDGTRMPVLRVVNHNHFRVNVSACASTGQHTISAMNGTVDFIKPFHMRDLQCELIIQVQDNHTLSTSFVMLRRNETTRDRVHVSLYRASGLLLQRTIYGETLSNHSINVTVNGTAFFTYMSSPENHNATALTFRFFIVRKSTPVTLKVVPLSNSTYSVMSPQFATKKSYPHNVNLSYVISVPDDHVALVVISHFDLGNFCSDYIVFTDSENHTIIETVCGMNYSMFPLRFLKSTTLNFVTNGYIANTGFKLLVSVVPISHEPQQLESGLYDCSVSYFGSFRELFSCNLRLECEAGEDEDICEYSDSSCGTGALDAGDKCYQLVWPNGTLTWKDALYVCENEAQNLATMATPAEWNRFKEIMAYGTNFHHRPIFVGLKLMDSVSLTPSLYSEVWTWVDQRSAFLNDMRLSRSITRPRCSYFSANTTSSAALEPCRCDEPMEALYICEFSKPNVSVAVSQDVDFPSLETNSNGSLTSLVACPSGELTFDFLSCDLEGPCDNEDYFQSCSVFDVNMPMYHCDRGKQTIPYTFVCDHENQCSDYSDEDFCQFSNRCESTEFQCRNQQCVDHQYICDGMYHCVDETDENCERDIHSLPSVVSLPATVHMDGAGKYTLSHTDQCPATHFSCSGGLCLPVYLRCNGFYDCPGSEDEDGCDSYSCPGFYHCRDSKVCLHPDNVCDKQFQCPQKDDELLCDLHCPNDCHCQGLSFKCSQRFSVQDFRYLRYLDVSETGMSLSDVRENKYLIRLHLSRCNLQSLAGIILKNLKHLDLSHNSLTAIGMSVFEQLTNLEHLDLSGNPLTVFTNSLSDRHDVSLLTALNLSNTQLDIYNSSMLSCCNKLEILDISYGSLREITTEGFATTPDLRHLYLQSSPLEVFPVDLLRSLQFLQTVEVDDFKLCCKAMLPDHFEAYHCRAQQDELASCDDLLQSQVHLVFLWLFALLSLCGNAGSFLTRFYMTKSRNRSEGMGSFSVFVTNLSVADFLMGVYLAIVGVADQVYRGRYVWKEDEWKKSAACQLAGFLSLLSSEVSAFIICLITVDRFLVLRFPFSRFHFHAKSALVASGIAWVAGLGLASVPLFPVTSHWKYYSQSGICIPLPFSNKARFLGYSYSFVVMICLNFVLFMLIAIGQAVIYLSVRANSMTVADSKQASRDATIARRLSAIVASDFLCWFPVGVIGMLAATGWGIPGMVNVTVAIFILPFNSALNPFLYTFNIIMEKRRKAYEARLLKQLEMRHMTEMSKTEKSKARGCTGKEAAMGMLNVWLKDKLLTPEDVASCLAPIIINTSTDTLTDGL